VEDGNITMNVLEEQIDWMKQKGAREEEPGGTGDAMLRSLLGEDKFSKVDMIERIQLFGVIQVCRESRTAAEAGRKLFTAPDHKQANHSHLVGTYLKRFGLHFSDLTKAGTG
jgi:transcriptional regulatory protein RtcR